MPTKNRSKRQRKSDKRALKFLRANKLYTGKIDLRKAPSRYQRKAIEKFSDLIRGKATLAKPASVKAYRGIFETFKDKVIVPRERGEKVIVEKGEVVKLKPRAGGGKPRRQKFLQREKVHTGEVKLKLNTRYGLPFKRGNSNLYDVRWFPNRDKLGKFMSEYEYDAWEDFVIEEAVDFEPDYAVEVKPESYVEAMVELSQRKRRSRRRKLIKFKQGKRGRARQSYLRKRDRE